MKAKVNKESDKSKEPFMAILTSEQISEGAAKFAKEVSSKIKPILYHNIREKDKIEAALASSIPEEKRSAISHALMDIFADIGDHKRDSRPPQKNG